jgi:MATE family multidrug resistance protein
VVAMGVVDTIVVGQLASHQLAWQALGWTINGPAMIGGIGLLFGVQVLSARAAGAGEPQEVGEAWRKGLVIAAAAGLLVCILVWAFAGALYAGIGIAPELIAPSALVAQVLVISLPLHLAFIASTNFLEALQRPLPGAIVMWAANLVNLLFNLVLVPQSGAIGSATATVLSRAFLFIALAVYITGHPELRAYLARPATPSRTSYRALLSIGVASAISSTVEAAAFASLGVIAARIGAASIAAFSIATGGLATLVYMIALGLSAAGTVLVSEGIGRAAYVEARRVGWIAILLAALGMIVCAAGCVLFASDVAGAFTADPETVVALVGVMGLVGLLMIPDGGQGVADAVLRARGINWYPTIVRILAFVAIAPPLAFWLAEREHLGLTGVMGALVCASSLAYGALLLRLAVARRIPSTAL